MDYKKIEARIKRNQFKELAGEYYRDNNSEIVQKLNNNGKSAYVGIERDGKTYTIIGEKSVYYLTETGVDGEILISDFLKILKENAWTIGKAGNFEFIKINDQDSIWVSNGEIMNAMWNTLLLLDDKVEH